MFYLQINFFKMGANTHEVSGWSTAPNTVRTISFKAWNTPVEFHNWEYICEINESHGNIINPILRKKAPGRKHPRKVSNLNPCSKKNGHGYKHPCDNNPDSKVHGANMGLIWGRQDPGGPHVGPMNIAIWVIIIMMKQDTNSYICKGNNVMIYIDSVKVKNS